MVYAKKVCEAGGRAAAAKKIGMRCDGLARAGGVDGGKRGTTSDGLRIGIGN